jgi:fluoride exporter
VPNVKVALIAAAGAAGALTRYAVASAVGLRAFPWATLAINVTGSFVLGLLLAFGLEREWSDDTIVPLAVGFLGAYTTFSTFSYETFTLMRTDRVPLAMAYVAASVVAGVLAAGAGYTLARRLA